MDFNKLIETISQTHEILKQQAVKAVNISLTLRNWLIGCYIVEFEQRGEDRAKYGVNLLGKLAQATRIRGLTASELSRCRQFYTVYPQIIGTASPQLKNLLSGSKAENILSDKIIGTASQKSNEQTEYSDILQSLSYSHFVELIKIDDSTKRNYYELLILKTHLSIKELKRQVASLSYERLGLSKDKAAAFKQIQSKIVPEKSVDIVKSHYFFEFLGINSPVLIEETQLEQALIDHLQCFMLELGYGFCFEARQKRILIGDEYFFIDLVFYHRILKCHVLVELKVDSYNHSHASQLITYLNYYRANIMEKGDNPPVGILLVTDKNNALIEYATANDKDRLFVSKYKLNLPSKEELKAFIENEIKSAI